MDDSRHDSPYVTPRWRRTPPAPFVDGLFRFFTDGEFDVSAAQDSVLGITGGVGTSDGAASHDKRGWQAVQCPRAGSSWRLPGVVHGGQPGVPLEIDAEVSVGAEASVGAAFEL